MIWFILAIIAVVLGAIFNQEGRQYYKPIRTRDSSYSKYDTIETGYINGHK